MPKFARGVRKAFDLLSITTHGRLWQDFPAFLSMPGFGDIISKKVIKMNVIS